MKIHFNNKMAAIYPDTFLQLDELKSVLSRAKIELHLVDEKALTIPVAAIMGFSLPNGIARPFGGNPPQESCLVFSGLTEDKLNKILGAIREAGIDIDFKAVLTNSNRDWAFGSLVYEMRNEKKKVETQE